MVVTGGSIGYFKSHALSMRVKFLEEFLNFITYMETQIRFCSDSLYKIVSRFDIENTSLSFLKYCCNEDKPFNVLWEESLKHIPSDTGLQDSDLKIISELGSGLGTSDVDGQIAHCEIYKSHINSRLCDAKDERNKKGKLYQMLGICAGLTVALLLI